MFLRARNPKIVVKKSLGTFLRYFFDPKREKYDLKNSYFLHIFNEKNGQGLEDLA